MTSLRYAYTTFDSVCLDCSVRLTNPRRNLVKFQVQNYLNEVSEVSYGNYAHRL